MGADGLDCSTVFGEQGLGLVTSAIVSCGDVLMNLGRHMLYLLYSASFVRKAWHVLHCRLVAPSCFSNDQSHEYF